MSGSPCRLKRSRKARFLAAAAGIGALASNHAALASPVTFTASSGNLAAAVKFDTSRHNLIVMLSNTSLNDVLVQSSVLCSVYFDVSGGSVLSLTPGSGSAKLGPGASVLFGNSGPGNNVGGEWAFKSGIPNKTTNHTNY